jgi:hypothetical protein
MTKRSPFRYFKTSPEIIRLAVMMYIWFPLSLRNVEDLLHERGIDISHKTARFWWNRFGPMFAAEVRRKRVQKYGIFINQCVTSQRRFDGSRVPSATFPRESVLPIRLRPDFFFVFEGYAGGAEHWPRRQVARKRSLRADILRT